MDKRPLTIARRKIVQNRTMLQHLLHDALPFSIAFSLPLFFLPQLRKSLAFFFPLSLTLPFAFALFLSFPLAFKLSFSLTFLFAFAFSLSFTFTFTFALLFGDGTHCKPRVPSMHGIRWRNIRGSGGLGMMHLLLWL